MIRLKKIETYYKGKRLLILGGAGFIGSNLTRKLVELGSKVIIIDALFPDCGGNIYNLDGLKNDKIRFIHADLTKYKSLSNILRHCDIVFNCMGYANHLGSQKNPFKDLRYNGYNHLYFLKACLNYNPKLKIVYLGSRSQYGKPIFNPVKEEHMMRPLDFHSAHKALGEFYHFLFSATLGLKTVSLRITNVYGPRQDMRRGNSSIINGFIRDIMENRKIEIFGTPFRKKCFLYISDLIDALLIVAANADFRGEVYNIGGKSVKISEAAKIIVKNLKRGSVKITPFPRNIKNIDTGEVILDVTKIKKRFTWRPKIELKEGLAETIEFYKKNKNRYW